MPLYRNGLRFFLAMRVRYDNVFCNAGWGDGVSVQKLQGSETVCAL